MNRKVSRVLSLILVFVMVISVSACGNDTKDASNSTTQSSTSTQAAAESSVQKEIKTLSLLMYTDWYTAGWQALEKHIADNPEKAGFKLDLQKIAGGSQGDQLIKVKFASDELPDLLQFYKSKWIDRELQALDKLVDLTGITSASEYDPKVLEGQYNYNGKLTGMPMGNSVLVGVFYNKKVFSDLNLTIPKTWDEFLAVCETIKADGKVTPVFYAGKDAWTLQVLPHFGFEKDIMDLGKKNTGDLFTDINTNKLKFADLKGFPDLMQKSKDLIEKGYVQKTYLSDNWDAQQQAIADGTAAMCFMGTWLTDNITKKFPDKVDGIGAFPVPYANNNVLMYLPSSIGVTTGAKDIEAAKAAISYITGSEAIQVYADAEPGIYLNKNVKSTVSPAAADLYKTVQEGKITTAWQDNNNFAYGDFASYIQAFYLGGGGFKTPQDVLKQIDVEYAKDAKAKNDPNWK